MSNFLMMLQIVGFTLQGSSELVSLLPKKHHPVFHSAVSLIQGIGGIVQRYYNPDGTRAQVAYVKADK